MAKRTPSKPTPPPLAPLVAGPADAPPEPMPPHLSRDGVELVWGDGSAGMLGFVVETAHHPGAWSVEAELPAGTTRYAPVRRPPSNTDFYRVRHAGQSRPSNVVVIHFN